jgi:uncharacterized protein (TIGR03086 family)
VDPDAVTSSTTSSTTPPPDDLPLTWISPVGERTPAGRVRYRGPLASADRPLHLHLGFDGTDEPYRDVALEREDDGAWTAEVPDTGDHLLVDCAVTVGREQWDNNAGADYRLWIGLDPVDSHVHVRAPGLEPMGLDSLRAALASGGMTHALVSWQDNGFVDRVTDGLSWLTRLVWVSPGGPSVAEVRRRLGDGAVGLKLHPSYDEYPADSPGLDPYLALAADAGAPVCVHTGPGPSDPDLIRKLAERYPQVPFVLYHTFLGLPEGRRRAARHAQELDNLYLETSWCSSDEVLRLLDEVGPERVLFGSDAAVDGPQHFVREPPNIELVENYNQGLLRLARELPPETFRALLEGNTRRLFRLPGAPAGIVEPDSPAALRELFAAALAMAEAVVAGVGPDDLARPTPCADWQVVDLLDHLLTTVRRAEQVARGARAPRPGRLDRWAVAFPAAARKARSAWATAAPGDVAVPWGLVPGHVALSGFVLELVAHTHDLAVALGRADVLDPGLAGAALRIAERLAPATLRGEDGPFAAPVPVPSTADAAVRLAAFLGRPSR